MRCKLCVYLLNKNTNTHSCSSVTVVLNVPSFALNTRTLNDTIICEENVFTFV